MTGRRRRSLRAERLAWLTIGLLALALTLAAIGVLAIDYIGDQRVQDCRENEVKGSDAWQACSRLGTLYG